MFTLCSPYVHPMFTLCSPYVHPMFTLCSPYVNMHSELYNQDGIKKVLKTNKDTQLNKSYKTPNQKSNNIVNRAKEDAQKGDNPYPKIPS
jgi:hypothetical protein